MSDAAAPVRLPLIALVGRPNVGKSTLFNRLVGARTALIDDRPGVTRDRIFGIGRNAGKAARFIDTGGFDKDSEDPLLARTREQTQLAIDEADLVIFVLDAQEGVRPGDDEVADLLRRSGRPVVAVVNKLDDPKHDELLYAFHELGIETLIGVSAEHARGMSNLWDALAARVTMGDEVEEESGAIPVSEQEPEGSTAIEWSGGPIKVAVVGRPNVGKSSLVNKLLGQERMMVSDIAGTTRDAIDVQLEHDGQAFVFIDTAGIRRKRSIADRLEKFAVMSAMRSIERCDVAVVVLDGTTRPSDQDARIVSLAHEAGKGVVLVANKWDLIENPEWKERYPEAVALDLQFASYARLVLLSAKTGKGTHNLFEPIVNAQRERHRRIGTGELNRFFREVVERHPPTLFKGKRANLYFVSQPMVRPPTFIFTAKNAGFVPDAYGRYLRNQLRERYGFEGTPLWLKFRPRGKAKERGRKGTTVD